MDETTRGESSASPTPLRGVGDALEILVDVEDPDVPPDEFVRSVYEMAQDYSKRLNGLYASDLRFNMIHIRNVYWMDQDHPVALMLAENGHPELASMRGDLGHLVVYSEASVKACCDSLVALCNDFNLKIIEEK